MSQGVALLTLLLTFGSAIGLGLFIHRMEVRKSDLDRRERRLVGEGMSATLGFVGGAAAFLLGVLLLSALDHYRATDNVVTDEALAFSSAFDSAARLPDPHSEKIQRDLVCLMRSVATNAWAATEREDLGGSPNTKAWWVRTIADLDRVEPTTASQTVSLENLNTQLVEASKAAQHRYLASESELPLAMWLLVFVSIFVLVVTLTPLLVPYPALAAVALGATFAVTAGMVWVLTAFAQPFTRHDGVYISPASLVAVTERLQTYHPNAGWGPCEALAER